MNIGYLREFLVFQKHMNFTTAAKELYISQPTLSNHVTALEKEMGVELVRHGQHLSLTQSGRALVREAPRLLALCDEVIEKCQLAQAEGGTITIARNHGTRSCCEDDFDTLISGFIAEHPGIFVQDIAWDDSAAWRTLQKSDADLVYLNYVMPSEDREQGMCSVPIPNYYDSHYCLWVDKSSPYASAELLTWADIDTLNVPMSTGQLLTANNIRVLCNLNHVKLVERQTPEFGWAYLQSFEKDESLIMDTAFMDYRGLASFSDRTFVPLSGAGSLVGPVMAYHPKNENSALFAFLDYTKSEMARVGKQ